MKYLLIILSLLLLSYPLFGQSEKPQTIVVPTGSLGEISEIRKKMLEKTLESKLDDYFNIVPKELFDEAQEKAFEELDYEECTEERCISMIQEILQVPNAFQLMLMSEEGDTQISLTWNDLEKKRVEEDFCEGCKTKDLRQMIEGLVEKLIGGKNLQQSLSIKKVTGILYRVTPRTKWIAEGKKWFKIGDEKTQPKYEGEIINNVPHGKGVMTFKGEKYVGEYKDGDRDGQGTHTFSDGKKYEGEWKNGLPNGQGTDTFPDGGKYVGEFKDGLPNGQGTLTSPDGEKYVGEFKDGGKNGEGVMTFKDGVKIIGLFQDNSPTSGKEVYPDGRRYEGHFSNWKKHGNGLMEFPDGRKIVGEFKDGYPIYGTETFPDGARYRGTYENGIFHGKGSITYPDRGRYIGEFKNGRPNGYGTYHMSDGRKFEGDFLNGKWHGKGTMTLKNGNRGVGDWKKNKPWNIIQYDTSGRVTGRIVNGFQQ